MCKEILLQVNPDLAQCLSLCLTAQHHSHFGMRGSVFDDSLDGLYVGIHLMERLLECEHDISRQMAVMSEPVRHLMVGVMKVYLGKLGLFRCSEEQGANPVVHFTLDFECGVEAINYCSGTQSCTRSRSLYSMNE